MNGKIGEVQAWKSALDSKLSRDINKYCRLARLNYYAALGIRWFAAAAGLLAGLLGLTNNASAPVVGGIAGVSGLLLALEGTSGFRAPHKAV
jgi:hypothetical protein